MDTLDELSSDVSHSKLDLSEDEKQRALRFALESESLCRSDRLKSMLSFVCEAEFKGELDRLSEYEIAVSALGRRSDFSPVEDSTVRSRAFELRQKLARLYSIEAPNYPIRIDLPKGSYRPRFYRLPPASAEVVASVARSSESAVSVGPKAKNWMLPVACFFAGVIITAGVFVERALIGAGRFHEPAANARWTPALIELWKPYLSSSRPILVVFETRLFVQVGPLVVRDTNIENVDNIESSAPIMAAKKLFNVPQVYETRRYSDFSVSNATFSLGQLLGTTGVAMKAIRADEMRNDEVSEDNLLLLGKPGAFDSVLGLAPSAFNFVYDKDRDIRNLHPLPGEPPLYAKEKPSAESGGISHKFALITFTTGVSRNQRVIILTSGESELFRPLGEYLTDPDDAADLVKHLRLPSGKLPEAFELLLQIEVRDQRALRVSYLTHRVLPAAGPR